MDTLQNAAKSYCNIRLIIGGVVGIILATILYYASYYISTNESLDTSFYLPVNGTRTDKNTIRKRDEDIETSTYRYTLDDKEYSAQVDGNGYNDIQQLYYNPESPEKYTFDLNGENRMSLILSGLATIVLVGAIIGIVLRNNSIFCGMTITKDILDRFKN